MQKNNQYCSFVASFLYEQWNVCDLLYFALAFFDMNSTELANVPGVKNRFPELRQTTSLSTNLRFLLRSKRLSETHLAKALGLPLITIKRITSGITPDPRVSTLQLLANYFELHIDDLLTKDNSILKNHLLTKNQYKLIPVLRWEDLNSGINLNSINFEQWTQWHPFAVNNRRPLGPKTFAVISQPEMRSLFPTRTLFVVDPQEPVDSGDLVLLQTGSHNALSLRKITTDTPIWQLQGFAPESQPFCYQPEKHSLLGAIIFTLTYNKHR